MDKLIIFEHFRQLVYFYMAHLVENNGVLMLISAANAVLVHLLYSIDFLLAEEILS